MYSKGGHSLGIGYNECVYEDGRNWLQYVQKELSVGELQDDLNEGKEIFIEVRKFLYWTTSITLFLIGSKSEHKSAQ